MAERRMFAKTIIDSDSFLEMPQSSQLLYFHLSMRADDDGFINKPKAIMNMTGTKEVDLNLLIIKKFIIPFESGIVVIKHWKIHNFIAKDRYTETKYKNEKSMLELDENKAYKAALDYLSTECIQVVNEMDTQVRLGKVSIDKDNIKEYVKKDEDSLSPNKFVDDSYQIKASKYLFEKIQSIDSKVKQPDFQKWAEQIDKLIRIDKRTEKEIAAVIVFATEDNFWKSNILSTAKLRDKFDTLFIQSKKFPIKQKQKENNFTNYDQRQYDYEELERKAMQDRIAKMNNHGG